jgi:hypothetical protein
VVRGIQGVTDQDRIARVRVQATVGLIRELVTRQHRSTLKRQRVANGQGLGLGNKGHGAKKPGSPKTGPGLNRAIRF